MTPYEDEVDPSAPGYDIWRSWKVLVAAPHLEPVRFVPEAEASKNLLMPVSHPFNRKMQPLYRDNWDGDPAENHLTERSEEHKSELQSLLRISSAVLYLKTI